MSERAAPFYCPYCGDEDLRPSEEGAGTGRGAAWECASCNRAFKLSFLGLLARGLPRGHDGDGPDATDGSDDTDGPDGTDGRAGGGTR